MPNTFCYQTAISKEHWWCVSFDRRAQALQAVFKSSGFRILLQGLLCRQQKKGRKLQLPQILVKACSSRCGEFLAVGAYKYESVLAFQHRDAWFVLQSTQTWIAAKKTCTISRVILQRNRFFVSNGCANDACNSTNRKVDEKSGVTQTTSGWISLDS